MNRTEYEMIQELESRISKFENIMQEQKSRMSKLEKRLDLYEKILFHDNIEKIEKILKEFGFKSSLKGYQYIIEGVCILIENGELGKYGCFTTIVYPMIAKRFNTSVPCVETGMRSAIKNAYKNNDSEGDAKLKVPKTSEFLISILQLIE